MMRQTGANEMGESFQETLNPPELRMMTDEVLKSPAIVEKRTRSILGPIANHDGKTGECWEQGDSMAEHTGLRVSV